MTLFVMAAVCFQTLYSNYTNYSSRPFKITFVYHDWVAFPSGSSFHLGRLPIWKRLKSKEVSICLFVLPFVPPEIFVMIVVGTLALAENNLAAITQPFINKTKRYQIMKFWLKKFWRFHREFGEIQCFNYNGILGAQTAWNRHFFTFKSFVWVSQY